MDPELAAPLEPARAKRRNRKALKTIRNLEVQPAEAVQPG